MYNPKEENIDLVREYFPSYHTIRFQDHGEPNIAVQDHFLQLTAKHTSDLTTKPGVKVQNLRYGGVDDSQVVDVFYKEDGTSSTGPSPLFVYIHGGYWQMLDKSNSCSIVVPLVDRGYRVAVMDYNNCPQVTLEQLLEQFTNFLIWIFDYAEKTEITEISFAGHSAGAHLLAQLLYMPSAQISEASRQKVRALFYICGVYDLRELWNLEPVNPDNILGLNAEGAVKLSPMVWDFKNNSKSWCDTQLYVISAQHESVTFIEQSRFFAKHLQGASFAVKFHLFDNYDHFDIIEDSINDNSPITTYLLAALQGSPN